MPQFRPPLLIGKFDPHQSGGPKNTIRCQLDRAAVRRDIRDATIVTWLPSPIDAGRADEFVVDWIAHHRALHEVVGVPSEIGDAGVFIQAEIVDGRNICDLFRLATGSCVAGSTATRMKTFPEDKPLDATLREFVTNLLNTALSAEQVALIRLVNTESISYPTLAVRYCESGPKPAKKALALYLSHQIQGDFCVKKIL